MALPDYFIFQENIADELETIIESDQFTSDFLGNSTTIYDLSFYTHATFTNYKATPYLEVPFIEWFIFISFFCNYPF